MAKAKTYLVTKKAHIEKIPEGSEIMWKGTDGKITWANLVFCFCGKRVYSNAVTVMDMPAHERKIMQNAEAFDLEEFNGDMDTETCDC